jgi:hypothetical protein
MGDRYLSLESFRVLSSPFDIIGALGPLLTYCILVSIYLGRAYQKHIVRKIGDQKGRERERERESDSHIHTYPTRVQKTGSTPSDALVCSGPH